MTEQQQQQCDSERRVAVSYYDLYSTLNESCLRAVVESANASPASSSLTIMADPATTTTTTTVSVTVSSRENDDNRNDNDGNELPFTPWVADAWSAADTETAARQLEAHADRCQIPAAARKEADAVAWDRFYQHHAVKFFKDRHYTAAEFPDEFGTSQSSSSSSSSRSSSNSSNSSSSTTTGSKQQCWVELGCGVGNALLPLLERYEYNDWIVYGLDLSATAIQHLRADGRYQQAAAANRAFAWPCDITRDFTNAAGTQATAAMGIAVAVASNKSKGEGTTMVSAKLGQAISIIPPEAGIPVGVATVTSLLFCLSAVNPAQHTQAVSNAAATLQPGGVVVFRDYGRYDQAQLSLGRQRHKRLSDSFYRKADGTKCYYFELDDLRRLFEGAGLEVLELDYVRRVYHNRSQGSARRRVWVQGRFRKPKRTITL